MKLIVAALIFALGTIPVHAAVLNYEYYGSEWAFCSDDCGWQDNLRTSFSIDTEHLPGPINGATIEVHVSAWWAGDPDFPIVEYSNNGLYNSFQIFEEPDVDGYYDLAPLAAWGLSGDLFRTILDAYYGPYNAMRFTFGPGGRVKSWFYGVLTGGSGDWRSSGSINGRGVESVGLFEDDARTKANGVWIIANRPDLAPVPLPASVGLLGVGVACLSLAGLRRRRALTA